MREVVAGNFPRFTYGNMVIWFLGEEETITMWDIASKEGWGDTGGFTWMPKGMIGIPWGKEEMISRSENAHVIGVIDEEVPILVS